MAAAADLQFALRDIARSYESRTGNTVKLTFGSSGALATQIQNGAPFDLFFSADASYPETLVKAKAADPATLVRYARGVLVLWVTKEQPMSGTVGGIVWASLDALTDARIRHVAIANAQHAPYGRAAVEAMKHAGVYAKVSPKLVVGENVLQAAQFAQSGNADAALLPLALAMTPDMAERGRYLPVSPDSYAPIVQAAVVTSQARDAALARDFLKYVTTTGMPVLTRYGFEPAEPSPTSAGGRK